LLHKAVMHLVGDGEYLLEMMRGAASSERDLILRAVFTIDENTGEPLLRRAAPVSLHALDARYAVTLAHLLDTAKPSQFVAWASLEPEDASSAAVRGVEPEGVLEAPAHTCAVVDAFLDRPVWEGPMHDPSKRRRHLDSRVGFTSGAQDEAVVPSSSLPRDNSPPPRSTNASPPRVLNATRRAFFTGDEGHDVASFDAPPSQPAYASASPLTEEQQTQLNDILSVTMLCSRATAKIMTSVVEAHARLDKLYDLTLPLASGPTTAEATDKVLQRLAELEARIKLMNEHVVAVEDKQEAVFREVRTRTAQRQEHSSQASVPTLVDRWMQTETFDIVRPEQFRMTVSPRHQLLPLAGAAPSNAYPSPPSAATEPAAAATGSSVPPTAQRAPARVSSPPKQLPLRTKAPSLALKRPLAAPPSNGSAAPAPALQSNMKLPTVNQPTTLAAPLLQRPSAVPSPPPSVPYEAGPQPSYSPSAASLDATLASANLEPQRTSELRHAQPEVAVESPPPPTERAFADLVVGTFRGGLIWHRDSCATGTTAHCASGAN
jgi:hypothetical protein